MVTSRRDLSPASIPPLRNRPAQNDFFVGLARYFYYAGMFTLPLLKLRAASFVTLSDVLFLIGAILLVLSGRVKDNPPIHGWWIGSVMFLATGCITSFVASTLVGSFIVVVQAIYLFVILQWGFRSIFKERAVLVRGMTYFILGCTLSSVYAFLQTKFHILGYYGSANSPNVRAIGLSTQPNLIGITDAVAITFLVGQILHYGPGKRFWRWIALGTIAISLILTASVSGMICSLLGVSILVFRRGVKITTVLAAAVLVVGVYLAGVAILGHGSKLDPFARISSTTNANTGTVSVREQTWKVAWAGIQNSPFLGHGLDAADTIVVFDPYVPASYATRNYFLLLWYQGGIFMLIGASICMLAAFRRTAGPGNRDPMRDTVFAGCIAVLAFAMQSPELIDRWFWFPFLLALSFRKGAAVPEISVSSRLTRRLHLLPEGTPQAALES